MSHMRPFRVVSRGLLSLLCISLLILALGTAAPSAHAVGTREQFSPGGVINWGGSTDTRNVPASAQSGVVAISAGVSFTLALKSDGSVIGWGGNGRGETTIPNGAQSGVIAIAAGNVHSLALKSDGRVLGWGYGGYGETTIPTAAQSGVVAIAAGYSTSLALKNDGSVVGWGYDSDGTTTIPTDAQSGIIAIAAGDDYAAGLKNDGHVVVWGDKSNIHGVRTVPTAAQSTVIAIAAGENHMLALKNNGSVVAWGENGNGQITVPAAAQSGVIGIAAGQGTSFALKSDGTIVAWGDNVVAPPSSLQGGVANITAHQFNNAALVATPLPTTISVNAVSGTYGGNAVSLSATLTGNNLGIIGKTITFTLNGTGVGSAITDSNGVATLANVSVSGIAAGNYATGVGAAFAGDSSYAASTGTGAATIAKATTSLTITAPATANVNTAFNASVTVSPQFSGTPTGSVAYTFGTQSGNASLVNGTATFSITPTAADVSATQTLGITYSGDANFTGSTGSKNINIGTPTGLVVNPASGTYGGTVGLSATLTASSGGVSGKSITFTLNGTSVGTATTNSSGAASLAAISLGSTSAGTYGAGVGATFAGDSTYQGSSATAALTVGKAALAVAADNKIIALGAPIPALTYTATGFVNGDTAATALTGALATVATSASPAGRYSIVQGTLAAANYTITFTPGTLTITPPNIALQLRVDPAAIKASKGKTDVVRLTLTNATGTAIAKGTPVTFTLTGISFKAGGATTTGGATVTSATAPKGKVAGSVVATLDADVAVGANLTITLTIAGKGGTKTTIKAGLSSFSSNSVTGIKTDGATQSLTTKKGKTGRTITGAFFANNEPVNITITPTAAGAPTNGTADSAGSVTLLLSSLAKGTYTVTITGAWSGVTGVVKFKN